METSIAFASWLGKTIEQSLSDTGVFAALSEIDSAIDELKSCAHDLVVTKCNSCEFVGFHDDPCVRSKNGKQ